MVFSRRHKLILVSLFFYWPAIFILTHMSVPQFIIRMRVSDKTLHYLGYFVLVFLFWFAINPDKKVNWRKATVWWVLLVVVWYGAFDEWLQHYVGRTADMKDFFADLIGVLSGLFLLSIFSFWPACLVVTGVVIFILTNFVKADLGRLVALPRGTLGLLAYGFFSLLWLKYIFNFLPIKAPAFRWLIRALILPVCLLFVVELFSIFVGRGFMLLRLVLSVLGIAGAVIPVYFAALIRQKKDMGV